VKALKLIAMLFSINFILAFNSGNCYVKDNKETQVTYLDLFKELERINGKIKYVAKEKWKRSWDKKDEFYNYPEKSENHERKIIVSSNMIDSNSFEIAITIVKCSLISIFNETIRFNVSRKKLEATELTKPLLLSKADSQITDHDDWTEVRTISSKRLIIEPPAFNDAVTLNGSINERHREVIIDKLTDVTDSITDTLEGTFSAIF